MVGNLVGKSPPSRVMLVLISSSKFSSVLFLETLYRYLLPFKKVYKVLKGLLSLQYSDLKVLEMFIIYQEVFVFQGYF